MDALSGQLAFMTIEPPSTSDQAQDQHRGPTVVRRKIPKPRQLTIRKQVERFQWRAHVPSRYDADSNAVVARKILKDGISREDLRQDISHHGDAQNRTATPVISTTWDLLRVLNLAKGMYEAGHTDVLILCIDTALLEKGNIVSCNILRHDLKLDKNRLYDTESLIWQRVPDSAILTKFTFERLQSSSFATLFPACFATTVGNSKRALFELRSALCSDAHNEACFNPRVLVQAMLGDLNLSPDHLVCDQLSMVLYGWRLGCSGQNDLPLLEQKILVNRKDLIKETQYRLYCASVQDKIARQAKSLSEAALQHVDILEETVNRVQLESMDAFEPWIAQRASVLDKLFAEGVYDKSSIGTFLTYCRVE